MWVKEVLDSKTADTAEHGNSQLASPQMPQTGAQWSTSPSQAHGASQGESHASLLEAWEARDTNTGEKSLTASNERQIRGNQK